MGEYGFKKLVVWQNARKLRKLIYDMTAKFSNSEMRRVSQMRDAARSTKQNIQEGYMSGSTGIYIRGLNVSKGSLSELSGDVEDCLEDELIPKDKFLEVNSLIERTEYLLKRLIQSLERKRQEQKGKKVVSKGQRG